jgi:tRNA-dihydrouridine synthase C
MTPAEPGLFLALAPMDGVTDWVWRQLMTDLADGHSGIDLCVSEFVRVSRDAVPAHVLLRECPELATGGRTRAGVPVSVQLLGSAPAPMAETARIAAELGAPAIDLNFGCPAKCVNGHDGGAALLREPSRIEAVVAAVRNAVPAAIPVSAKVRLGWDSCTSIEDIARAAEAGGASWLTVHARTRVQLYRPPVDWIAIGRARQSVAIPVVANGDIASVDDLRACAQRSGCHGFMIGRAAMGIPDLFRRLRGWSGRAIDRAVWCALLRDYAARLLAAGAEERAALGRVKQWLRLGAPFDADLTELFARTKQLARLHDALAVLATPRAVESAPAACARW